MWQIDIFTFELKRMYPVYLIGMIDDHSRYIVGHGLFRQQKAEAVLEVVRGAIGQWGAPRELLSDNGRQFVAWRGTTQFQKVLKRHGVQHVRSAPHHPMTLGKIERFWKTIWDEFLSDAVFASFPDARQRLDHWVAYYNHQRPHQGIDGACPADRFYGVAGDVEEALKHGCQENPLRIALGQETRPPLFLLGKLGETDVRVTRKGDDIELRVGEDVHEVIRLGAPCTVSQDGTIEREEQHRGVEGHERGRALPAGRDGAQGPGAAQADLRDLRSQPPDAVPSHGEGEHGLDRVARTQETWPQAQAPRGGPGGRVPQEGRGPGEAGRGVQDPLPDGQDLPGARTPVRRGASADTGPGGGAGKKKGCPSETPEVEEQPAKEPPTPLGSDSSGMSMWPWATNDDGSWE